MYRIPASSHISEFASRVYQGKLKPCVTRLSTCGRWSLAASYIAIGHFCRGDFFKGSDWLKDVVYLRLHLARTSSSAWRGAFWRQASSLTCTPSPGFVAAGGADAPLNPPVTSNTSPSAGVGRWGSRRSSSTNTAASTSSRSNCT